MLSLKPTQSDWITHQHRDTLASIVGHPPLSSYLAIADGEAIGRVKFEMTEVRFSFSTFSVINRNLIRLFSQRMLQPCGPPPQRDED